jgi:hypothetical protein
LYTGYSYLINFSPVAYDAATHLFRVPVLAASGGSAAIEVQAARLRGRGNSGAVDKRE